MLLRTFRTPDGALNAVYGRALAYGHHDEPIVLRLVQILASAGANIASPHAADKRPWYLRAAKLGHTGVLAMAMDAGEPPQNLAEALCWSILCGHDGAVRFLVRRGVPCDVLVQLEEDAEPQSWSELAYMQSNRRTETYTALRAAREAGRPDLLNTVLHPCLATLDASNPQALRWRGRRWDAAQREFTELWLTHIEERQGARALFAALSQLLEAWAITLPRKKLLELELWRRTPRRVLCVVLWGAAQWQVRDGSLRGLLDGVGSGGDLGRWPEMVELADETMARIHRSRNGFNAGIRALMSLGVRVAPEAPLMATE